MRWCDNTSLRSSREVQRSGRASGRAAVRVCGGMPCKCKCCDRKGSTAERNTVRRWQRSRSISSSIRTTSILPNIRYPTIGRRGRSVPHSKTCARIAWCVRGDRGRFPDISHHARAGLTRNECQEPLGASCYAGRWPAGRRAIVGGVIIATRCWLQLRGPGPRCIGQMISASGSTTLL